MLPPYPEPLSERALRQLERLGVEVRRGAKVTRVDALGVVLGEERLEARTVVWAAGVQASPLARSLGAALDRSGRVRVREDLSVPGGPKGRPPTDRDSRGSITPSLRPFREPFDEREPGPVISAVPDTAGKGVHF